ncbi:hypothetical protein GPZ77_34430 (plasmid) [Streptomyces sp. QHH-9511]|uniref:hypothetical protein n=1 Tax=Streptomyces sp. QHH-9511 TaxID=2684468 RepID=UPI00131755C9|nr:hypothetical protein [Streptomyces sp. QHH-9511]QGZ53329.1 hypothetical protein GPZ77_34430 [Streptomyces sp. QHH-9511]
MPVSLTCVRCSSTFTVPPSRAGSKYCSQQCFRAQQTEDTAWVSRSCAHCAEEFRVRGKEAASRGTYCSIGCWQAATGRKSRRCEQCEAEFFPKTPNNPAGTLRGRFCSKTCSGLAQRTRVTRSCRQCGDEFEIKASRLASGRGQYCSKACQALAEGSEDRSCLACGETFRAVRSVIARGWGSYCSQPCTARRLDCSCQVCGAAFTVKGSVADNGGGKYCSDGCRHIGTRNRVVKKCPVCGLEFEVQASTEQRGRRTCSKVCRAQFLRTDPERLAVLARARHEQLTSRAPTRPERILYSLLDNVIAEAGLDLVWEPQFRLSRWTVDAAIPAFRIVLQADGDYWHGLRPEWREDPRVQRNMANDAYQNRKLPEAGWRVLRFWESDLIHHLPACAERLRSALTEAGLPE